MKEKNKRNGEAAIPVEQDLPLIEVDCSGKQQQQLGTNDYMFKTLQENYLMMVEAEEKEIDLYGYRKPELDPDQIDAYDVHIEYDPALVNLHFGFLKNQLAVISNLLSGRFSRVRED